MLLFALASSPAHAFAEDLCYRNGRGLASCNDLACDPGEDDFRCTADAVTDIARLAGGGRSMVHVDATFYLAQAVGLDASTAYWVAA